MVGFTSILDFLRSWVPQISFILSGLITQVSQFCFENDGKKLNIDNKGIKSENIKNIL